MMVFPLLGLLWSIFTSILKQARTLFATHYHELNEMEKSFKRIKNYNVSVKEIDNKVIFLRKLERGGSETFFRYSCGKDGRYAEKHREACQ